jgi:hypothetical protein
MSSAAPVAALAALSLTGVACSGSETSAEPGSPGAATIADAVDETLAAGTARVTVTFEHTREERTFGVEVGERDSVEGAVDFELRRTEIGSEIDTFVIDESSYFVHEEPDPQWHRFSRDPKPGDAVPPDYSLGRLDVIRQLGYAAAIEGSFEAVGEEEVGGMATTRYSGVGEAEALMRALLDESLYEKLRWSTHSTSVDRSESVSFDVWVGEDGRVHKVVYDFPDFSSFLGDLTTIELRDFGADVAIEVPAPEDTVDG